MSGDLLIPEMIFLSLNPQCVNTNLQLNLILGSPNCIGGPAFLFWSLKGLKCRCRSSKSLCDYLVLHF